MHRLIFGAYFFGPPCSFRHGLRMFECAKVELIVLPIFVDVVCTQPAPPVSRPGGRQDRPVPPVPASLPPMSPPADEDYEVAEVVRSCSLSLA